MQPLTPNERREVEQKINTIKNLCSDQRAVLSYRDKELWLKVLSMALAQDDAILEEWRKR